MTTTSCLKSVTPTSQRLDRSAPATTPRNNLVQPTRPASTGAAKRFLKTLLNSLSAWAV
jgi:hypothetical protein